MTSTPRARLIFLLVASAVSIAWALCAERAYSGESPTQATSEGSSSQVKGEPETVTIEARRAELKRQISRFVASVVVSYLNDSLARWDTPICPLVAGLPADRGEFILARVSQIARTSHAPLAGEHCKPNFFVVVAANPQPLIKRWSIRDRRLFNTCNGLGYINDFMRSKAPVRVWYNTDFRSRAGVTRASDAASQLALSGLTLDFALPPCASGGEELGTRLKYGDVQALASVIVVVDANRAAGINIGQLADYIAMAGFAQIHLDANTGTAPTILSLFRSEQAPQGLSPWDESFLHSVYTTNQQSVMQESAIKRGMFEQIGR